MSDEELAAKIDAECFSGDQERDHERADAIIIGKLTELGFTKTAAAWDRVHKWYA